MKIKINKKEKEKKIDMTQDKASNFYFCFASAETNT